MVAARGGDVCEYSLWDRRVSSWFIVALSAVVQIALLDFKFLRTNHSRVDGGVSCPMELSKMYLWPSNSLSWNDEHKIFIIPIIVISSHINCNEKKENASWWNKITWSTIYNQDAPKFQFRKNVWPSPPKTPNINSKESKIQQNFNVLRHI